MAITKLKSSQLKKNINLRSLPFRTTDEIEPLKDIIGQDRAIRAIELALEMDHSGYNVFVTGLSGSGKTTIVNGILQDIARDKPVPCDWVYVYNFEDPDMPLALELPPCRAKKFLLDMDELVATLKRELPMTFNSEEYNKQTAEIVNRHTQLKQELMKRLDKKAASLDLQVRSTSSGFETIILEKGKPLEPAEYDSLSRAKKDAIKKRVQEIESYIDETIRQMVKIDRAIQQEIRETNEQIATFIVTRYITELQVEYKDSTEVVDYLEALSRDLITNIGAFVARSQSEEGSKGEARREINHFKRYEVNVIVSNDRLRGAPVIYEPNPTYNNLFGRVEKQVVMGSQVTDFTMIKPGSLHKANGGYLVTDATHLLRSPFVYDALKRAIKTRKIRIEDVSELYGYATTAALKPQEIPLNLKVILIGHGHIYHMLQSYDQDFGKIFKIRADFDYETDSNRENILKYAQFIRRVVDEEGLLPFHRDAVREIAALGHRLVDDQKKISLRFGSLMGILREASHYASKKGESAVRARHVQYAEKEHEFRHNMAYEKTREMYRREIYRVDTSGEKVGQINGLAVYSVGGFSFGRPGRITAKSYIGSENLINIERKARLSGKIHDKGLLILTGFFNSKFGTYMPLNFSASLTFEQSYSMIDGDSASSTELYALISSLANVPIKQGIAVTGSVNQNGEVQAIGGVNQKIEGYFDVCRDKGLSGEQGVIIPRSNVENLMLQNRVINAVKNGRFHIWAVDTIEDGLRILTGREPGERRRNGKFPRNSIYGQVEHQLRTFARRADAFRKSIGGKEKESKKKETTGEEEESEE